MSEYYNKDNLGKKELEQAKRNEDIDSTLQKLKDNREEKNLKAHESANPYTAYYDKLTQLEEHTRKNKALLAESDRHQREIIGINTANQLESLNRATDIDRSQDPARQYAMTGNVSSLTQDEFDALRRQGKLDLSNDAATINELNRRQNYNSKRMNILDQASNKFDLQDANYRHQLNKLGIETDFLYNELNKYKNKIDTEYKLQETNNKQLAETLSNIYNLGVSSIDAPNQNFTEGHFQSFIQPFLTVMDEGATSAVNWVTAGGVGKVEPFRTITDFLGITDEGYDWKDVYSNKFDTSWGSYANFDRITQLALNGLGSTAGFLVEGFLVSKGANLVTKLPSLLNRARNAVEETNKAIKAAQIAGRANEVAALEVGKSLFTKALEKITYQQAINFPFITMGRSVGIAEDRARLEGREYSRDELRASDFGWGALSASMDTLTAPLTIGLAGAATKFLKEGIRNKTLSKVLGGSAALPAALTAELAVTEGMTEVVSTASELAGVYGWDISDIINLYNSDDPNNAWVKEAIRTSFVTGILGGMPLAGAGTALQSYQSYKDSRSDTRRTNTVSQNIAGQYDTLVSQGIMTQEQKKTADDSMRNINNYYSREITDLNNLKRENNIEGINETIEARKEQLENNNATIRAMAHSIARDNKDGAVIAQKTKELAELAKEIETQNKKENKPTKISEIIDKAEEKGLINKESLLNSLKELKNSTIAQREQQRQNEITKEESEAEKSWMERAKDKAVDIANQAKDKASNLANQAKEKVLGKQEEETSEKNMLNPEAEDSIASIDSDGTITYKAPKLLGNRRTNVQAEEARRINERNEKQENEALDATLEMMIKGYNNLKDDIGYNDALSKAFYQLENNEKFDKDTAKLVIASAMKKTLKQLKNKDINTLDVTNLVDEILAEKLTDKETGIIDKDEFSKIKPFMIEILAEARKPIAEEVINAKDMLTEDIALFDEFNEKVAEISRLLNIYHSSNNKKEIRDNIESLKNQAIEIINKMKEKNEELQKYAESLEEGEGKQQVEYLLFKKSQYFKAALDKIPAINKSLRAIKDKVESINDINKVNKNKLASYLTKMINKILDGFSIFFKGIIENIMTAKKEEIPSVIEGIDITLNAFEQIQKESEKYNEIIKKQLENYSKNGELIKGSKRAMIDAVSMNGKTSNFALPIHALLENLLHKPLMNKYFNLNSTNVKAAIKTGLTELIKKKLTNGKEGLKVDNDVYRILSLFFTDEQITSFASLDYKVIAMKVEEYLDNNRMPFIEQVLESIMYAKIQNTGSTTSTSKGVKVSGYRIFDNQFINIANSLKNDTNGENDTFIRQLGFQFFGAGFMSLNRYDQNAWISLADIVMNELARKSSDGKSKKAHPILVNFSSTKAELNLTTQLVENVIKTPENENTVDITNKELANLLSAKYYDDTKDKNILYDLKKELRNIYQKEGFFGVLKYVQEHKRTKFKIRISKDDKNLSYTAFVENNPFFNILQDMDAARKEDQKRQEKASKEAVSLTPISFKGTALEGSAIDFLSNSGMAKDKEVEAFMKELGWLDNFDTTQKITQEEYDELMLMLENGQVSDIDLSNYLYIPNYKEIKDKDNNIRLEQDGYIKLNIKPEQRALYDLNDIFEKEDIIKNFSVHKNEIQKLKDKAVEIGQARSLLMSENTQPMYFNYFFQEQKRQQVNNNIYNFQNNKLVRNLLFRANDSKGDYTTEKLLKDLDQHERTKLHDYLTDLVIELYGMERMVTENGLVGAKLVFPKGKEKYNPDALIDSLFGNQKLIKEFLTDYINENKNSYDITDDDSHLLLNAIKILNAINTGKINPLLIRKHIDGSATGSTQRSSYVDRATNKAKEGFGQPRYFKNNTVFFNKENTKLQYSLKWKEQGFATIDDIIESLKDDYPYGNMMYNFYHQFNKYIPKTTKDSNILVHTFKDMISSYNGKINYQDAKKIRTQIRDIAKTIATPFGYNKNIKNLFGDINSNELQKSLAEYAEKTLLSQLDTNKEITEQLKELSQGNGLVANLANKVLKGLNGQINEQENLRSIIREKILDIFNNEKTVDNANFLLARLSPQSFFAAKPKETNILVATNENFSDQLKAMESYLRSVAQGKTGLLNSLLFDALSTHNKGKNKNGLFFYYDRTSKSWKAKKVSRNKIGLLKAFDLLEEKNGKYYMKGKADYNKKKEEIEAVIKYYKHLLKTKNVYSIDDLTNEGMVYQALNSIAGNARVVEDAGQIKQELFAVTLQQLEIKTTLEAFKEILPDDKVIAHNLKEKIKNTKTHTEAIKVISEAFNKLNDTDKLKIQTKQKDLFLASINDLIGQYDIRGLTLAKNNTSTEGTTKFKNKVSEIVSNEYAGIRYTVASLETDTVGKTTIVDTFDNIISEVFSLVEHTNEANAVEQITLEEYLNFSIYDAFDVSYMNMDEIVEKWNKYLIEQTALNQSGTVFGALITMMEYFNAKSFEGKNEILSKLSKSSIDKLARILSAHNKFDSFPNINMKEIGTSVPQGVETSLGGVYGIRMDEAYNEDGSPKEGTKLDTLVKAIKTITNLSNIQMKDNQDQKDADTLLQYKINSVSHNVLKSLPNHATDKRFAKEGVIVSDNLVLDSNLNIEQDELSVQREIDYEGSIPHTVEVPRKTISRELMDNPKIDQSYKDKTNQATRSYAYLSKIANYKFTGRTEASDNVKRELYNKAFLETAKEQTKGKATIIYINNDETIPNSIYEVFGENADIIVVNKRNGKVLTDNYVDIKNKNNNVVIYDDTANTNTIYNDAVKSTVKGISNGKFTYYGFNNNFETESVLNLSNKDNFNRQKFQRNYNNKLKDEEYNIFKFERNPLSEADNALSNKDYKTAYTSLFNLMKAKDSNNHVIPTLYLSKDTQLVNPEVLQMLTEVIEIIKNGTASDIINKETGEVILTAQEIMNLINNNPLQNTVEIDNMALEEAGIETEETNEIEEYFDETNDINYEVEEEIETENELENKQEIEEKNSIDPNYVNKQKDEIYDEIDAIEGKKKSDERNQVDSENIGKINHNDIVAASKKIDKKEAMESLRNSIDKLGTGKIANILRQMFSKILTNLPENIEFIKVPKFLLKGRKGTQFTLNGKIYIAVSIEDYVLNNDTLGHEITHAALQDIFLSNKFRGALNILSKIRFIKQNVIKQLEKLHGTEKGNKLLYELGLVDIDGKWTAIWRAITEGKHSDEEFAVYFATNPRRLQYLDNFRKDATNEPRYDNNGNEISKGNTLGILKEGVINFFKEILYMLSLGKIDFAERSNYTYADELTNAIADLSDYNNEEVVARLERSIYETSMKIMDTTVSNVISKLPVLNVIISEDNYTRKLKDKGKTQEEIDKIKLEIRRNILEEWNKASDKGFGKLANSFFTVVKAMFWKTPLHREVAITIFNEYLDSSNKEIAKGFQNLLKTVRIIGMNNYTEREKMAGEKGALDKAINQNLTEYKSFLDNIFQYTIGKEKYKELEEASLDFKPEKQNFEKDPYGINQLSPMERLKRAFSIFYITGMSSGNMGEHRKANFKKDFVENLDMLLYGDEASIQDKIDNTKDELKQAIAQIFNNSGIKMDWKKIDNKALIYFYNNTTELAAQRLYGGSARKGLQNTSSILFNTTMKGDVKLIKGQSYNLKQMYELMSKATDNHKIADILTLKSVLYNITTMKAIKLLKQDKYSSNEQLNENFAFHMGAHKVNIEIIKQSLGIEQETTENFVSGVLTMATEYNQQQSASHIKNMVIPTVKYKEYMDKKQELFIAMRKSTKNDVKLIEKLQKELNELEQQATTTIKVDEFQTYDFRNDFSRDVYETFANNFNRKIIALNNVSLEGNPELESAAAEYYKGITRNGSTTNFKDTVVWLVKRGFKIVDPTTNHPIENIDVDSKDFQNELEMTRNIALVYDGNDISNDITTAFILQGNSFVNKGAELSSNYTLTESDRKNIMNISRKRKENSIRLSSEKDENKQLEEVVEDLFHTQERYTSIAGSNTKFRTLMSRYHFNTLTQADTSMESVTLEMTRNNYKHREEEAINSKVINSLIDDQVTMARQGKMDKVRNEWVNIYSDDYTKETLSKEQRLRRERDINRIQALAPNILLQIRTLLDEYNANIPEKDQIHDLYVPSDMIDLITGIETKSITGFMTEYLSNLEYNTPLKSLASNAKFVAGLQWIGHKLHELMNDAKVNIVIRNYRVLFSNAVSQCLSMVGLGLDPRNIIADIPAIYNDIQRFEEDSITLYKLENTYNNIIKNNDISDNNIARRLLEVKNKMNSVRQRIITNRVYFPMTYGADTNIMDETKQDDSYMSNLYREGYNKIADTLGLNKVLERMGISKTFVRENIIASSTSELYKWNVNLNRLSDMIPKIIAYETYLREGYSKSEAMNKAQTVLINYVTPLESGFLRVAERIGFLPFARFAVRVIPALFQNIGDRPVSTAMAALTGLMTETAATTVGLGSFVGMPIYNEAFSSLPNKVSDPFGMVFDPSNMVRWGFLFD